MFYTLGRYTGILVAESMWLMESGVKTGISYYMAKASVEQVSKIAIEHSIDSNDPEAVTENLFECLEYLD